MCGRARCSLAREAVTTAAGINEQRWRDQAKFRPSYNCSPGAWIPVIKLGADGARELQTMKWGLVPAFTRLGPGERPDHFRMFNARCESLAQKPVFSRLLQGKRCVVLLDGFYEWHSQGGGGGAASRKQPYHITTAADGPQQSAMYLAGLYDIHNDPTNGEPLHTFTIVTTDSSKPLAWLHDRMPVLLTTQEEVSAWLGEGKVEPRGADGAAAAEDAAPKAGGAAAAATTPRESQRPSPSPVPPLRASLGSPSTPSSHGRSGGGGAGAAAGAASTGEGGAETKARGDGAAEAIAVTDDSDDGGSGNGDDEVAEGSSDDDRCSQGRVGSSQEDTRAVRGKGRGGKPAPSKIKGAVSEAEKMRCEELVEKICRPYGGPLLRWHPVTPDMSKPAYDKPDCCKDVRTKKGSIGSFFKPAGKGASPASAPAAAPAAVKRETQQGKDAMDGKDGGKTAGVAKAEASIRNSDECVGADGGTGSAGAKRPAEGQAWSADAPIAKKR